MRSVAVQAHRGSPDPVHGVRENTLEAFLRAGELGADGVELDVRMTSDGALAIHHDAVVEGAGPICELTAAELPAHIPLLADVLEICDGLTVNIEIKNLPGELGFDPDDVVAREVADLVAATGRQSGVVISSFWPDSLDAVRLAQADLATGLLIPSWFDPTEGITMATGRGCTAFHPHVDVVDAPLVERAHEVGLSVATWTVNDPTDLATVAGLGVDTVITDDVGLALGTLRGS